jgi:hypothetical protein
MFGYVVVIVGCRYVVVGYKMMGLEKGYFGCRLVALGKMYFRCMLEGLRNRYFGCMTVVGWYVAVGQMAVVLGYSSNTHPTNMGCNLFYTE